MRCLNYGCLGIIALSFVAFFTIDIPPHDASADVIETMTAHEEPMYPSTANIAGYDEVEPKTALLFVGDIMLGRHVEKLSLERGFEYPYKNVLTILQSADYTVGNFEGTVPSKHIPTQAYEMQFSFADDAFHQAAVTGFDILSLGNNHSDDYGEDGYQNTKNICSLYEITCAGHPTEVSLENSVSYLDTEKDVVGIIFIDGTERLSTSSLSVLIKQVIKRSDIQLVYIHWGDEYKLVNNTSQQKLAHFFVDMGIDAVIGHHPHVVQNVELYRGAPIVYSLGNFIFDQYFSFDVQHGLMLGLQIDTEEIVLTFFGLTSLDSPSSPKLMTYAEEQKLFKRIFKSINASEGVDGLSGHIVIKR